MYSGWLAYDDTVDQPWGAPVQTDSWELMPNKMPDLMKPDVIPYESYTLTGKGGFFCNVACSTTVDDTLFIINAWFTDKLLQRQDKWPMMVRFDMDESVEAFLDQNSYESLLPNNYYLDGVDGQGAFDTLKLDGEGCTTNNGTHVLHFNWAFPKVDDSEYSYPSTFIYDIEADAWTLATGNPAEKFNFGCAPDATGRYIYLFGGTNISTLVGFGYANSPSRDLATDRYDTWTDEWRRLNATADYPEAFGRANGIAVTDKTSNQILLFGGFQADPDLGTVPPQKVEIFRVETEDWLINDDMIDDLYLDEAGTAFGIVNVNDFQPNGQNTNDSADTIFLFGGGSSTDYSSNFIQFVSILAERQFYENNKVVLEAQNPGKDDIDDYAFDPWQRFELEFRIVITDGVPYLIDEDWTIEFLIDGRDLATVSSNYGVNILSRPSCICFNVACAHMPDNVQQVVVAQLLIPSHRTLHNGYCVDESTDWIFSHDKPSIITLTASKFVIS